MGGSFVFSVDNFPMEIEIDGSCVDSKQFPDGYSALAKAKELAKELARARFEDVLKQIDEQTFGEVYDDCEPDYNY